MNSGRAGFCAVLGLPNVGKSTLLNRLLERRLLAVSNKPQTTRNRILGILNQDGSPPAQIVFVDTPGIQTGKGALRRYMRHESHTAAGECDVAVLVIDATDRKQHNPRATLERAGGAVRDLLAATKAPIVLAINKVDRVRDKSELLPILEAYGADERFQAIVPMSARTGRGTEALVGEVVSRLPEGPPLFPEDQLTDRPERFLAADLIREQLFRQLGQELPYATACIIEAWDERQDKGDVVIDAVIYVERDSQKGIVVGKGGSRIREVGERARASVSELLGCPVHLKLLVKVSRDWSRDQAGLRDMGYET